MYSEFNEQLYQRWFCRSGERGTVVELFTGGIEEIK